jgi:pyrroloquinoline quinone (PQQ) biosynthesis protein C
VQFFQQLQEQTTQEREYFLSSPIIADVMEGDFSLSTYLAFLNQAYHHVRHTVPLLMSAGATLRGDQLSLQSAISRYIAEEIGHEHWILDDLEACGADREKFAEDPAPFDSEIMVAYLYDTIQRKNPAGLFGMVMVLEGTSADLATPVAELVQAKLGLPDSAMSYLRSHGELDQAHMQFFESLMNSVTSSIDQEAITQVARDVYRLYGNVYRAIPVEAGFLNAGSPNSGFLNPGKVA